MTSKGPRSKLDHESRARRQKGLEALREPRRPKTHWDHVLEEMAWLSKDFEAERKWKMGLAKKVALRASKGMVDQAAKGEKKLKEEEQRMRKVAQNISKDVKKFWNKIEKLVLYKHQMELDEKKKKVLDKQLEFLLGQTERYSTMLAENLVDKPSGNYLEPRVLDIQPEGAVENDCDEHAELDSDDLLAELATEPHSDGADVDEDYDVHSEDNLEDDEHTLEEDEALITKEERLEELAALHSEIDLPIEELLKRYAEPEINGDDSVNKDECVAQPYHGGEGNSAGKDNLLINTSSSPAITAFHCDDSNGALFNSDNHLIENEVCHSRNMANISGKTVKEQLLFDFSDEQEDADFVLATGEDMDDETTLLEEEELSISDLNNPIDEIMLLQKESETPLDELLARYGKKFESGEPSEDGDEYASSLSDDIVDSLVMEHIDIKQKYLSIDEVVEHRESLEALDPFKEEQAAAPGNKFEEGRGSKDKIADAAAAARSAQPTGNTFSTTKVRTKFPFLLKHPLREYQHIGLDWLVTMYEKRLNGILADEMGLGKTIMTISLLAHLACEKGIWGAHLIVVPTSVMLNWETKFLKWCPAFKILTYFGSAKERKLKRQGWDADFATEAYRQQVEALAQHQLMEELEYEAKLKDDAYDGNLDSMNAMSRDPKPKPKKKLKRTKFKSLKKGSLTSDQKHLKEEQSMELMSIDEDSESQDATDSDTVSPHSSIPRKRKKAKNDHVGEKSSKKLKNSKKGRHLDLDSDKQPSKFMKMKSCQVIGLYIEQKPTGRSKMGGKISITTMPLKRVFMIKPEKLKKGTLWSRDFVPSPDFWLSQEDAILCAVVHEYGPHWSLVSNTLYGMAAGGIYRGRYRDPVHCCERFRELVQKYILSAPDITSNEKTSNAVSGKALKVTEDNIRALLQVAMEQTDDEFLLQRHFTALLSALWRVSSPGHCRLNSFLSQNSLYFGGKFDSSTISQKFQHTGNAREKQVKFNNLEQSSKLIAAALHDTGSRIQETETTTFSHVTAVPAVKEQLDITLEFCQKVDPLFPLTHFLHLSLSMDTCFCTSVNKDMAHHTKGYANFAEDHFRAAARACVNGNSVEWASSAFAVNGSATKSESVGKQKVSLSVSGSSKVGKSKSKKSRLTEGMEVCSRRLVDEFAFPEMETVMPNNPDLEFDDVQSDLSLCLLSPCHLPHEYAPEFIVGLDDCLLEPEFTDIG